MTKRSSPTFRAVDFDARPPAGSAVFVKSRFRCYSRSCSAGVALFVALFAGVLTAGFFVALLCADDAGGLRPAALDATEPDVADFRGADFRAAELRAVVRLVDEVFARVVVFRAGISPP